VIIGTELIGRTTVRSLATAIGRWLKYLDVRIDSRTRLTGGESQKNGYSNCKENGKGIMN
jgi:hypothetical protein